MKLKYILIQTALLFTILLSSCVKPISADVYSTRQVGEVSMTYPGVIKNIREVVIEKNDSGTGAIGGAVVGSLAGNAMGRGFFPFAAGAIVGGVGGSLIERKLNKQAAWEYILELNDGALVTVVQGQDEAFSIGQQVYVIISHSGRSRIIPL